MLSLRNLEVTYQDIIHVLHGISLDVPDGAVVALLGANGAGKTTVARAISGLLRIHDGAVSRGDIAWEGSSLLGLDERSRAGLGLAQVMEGRRIFTSMTVEDNLVAGGYGRLARRDLAGAIEEIYATFPALADLADRRAGYLSGGEQQMLAIGRALIGRPRLLILDEPSLGLSPVMRQQLAEIIRAVNQRPTSILLVEQDARMALGVAEHGYILDAGRIVHEGTSAELLDDAEIQEFYLGIHEGTRRRMQDVKRYRRRKRWLS